MATPLIDDGEHTKRAAVRQRIMDNVHAPALGGLRGPRRGAAMPGNVSCGDDTARNQATGGLEVATAVRCRCRGSHCCGVRADHRALLLTIDNSDYPKRRTVRGHVQTGTGKVWGAASLNVFLVHRSSDTIRKLGEIES